MNTAMLFVVLVFAVFAIWLAWFIKASDVDVREYFSNRTGLGIAKGVLIVLVLAACIGFLSGCTGKYMNNASVFVGMDYTKNPSPVCDPGPDSRTTSNLGARLNLWQSDDNHLNVNGKYTHHSCVFNADSYSYDGAGVEIDYLIFER